MAYLNGNPVLINAHVVCDTDASYLAGRKSGYDEGHTAGYAEGYADGIPMGYNQGEAAGYKEGQRSMAVMQAVQGNPVVLDYVHPTEHELGVTLSRCNLLDLSKCRVNTAVAFGLTYELLDDVVHVYGTVNSGNGGYISMVVLFVDEQPELEGKGYVVQAFNVDTGKAMTEQECNFRTYGLRTAGENVIAITIVNSPIGMEVDYRFRVGVNEVAQTTYGSYIADLSGITLTRCGKNLFKANWLEDYLHPGEIVEFEGRRCYKTKLKSDNYFRINGKNYANITFPFPIHQFSIEAYSVSPNGSIGLYDKTGKVLTYKSVASSDITNWRTTHTFTNDVYGLSFYSWHDSEDETIYIDLDSMYVSTSLTVEEPEPYVGEDYTPNADGTVEGVTSLSPLTTLTADDGVMIHAEYWLDTESKLKDMGVTLLDLGGEL